MPYKAEKIKLSETQDRRRKLTEKQKEEIKAIYATGVCGTRPLEIGRASCRERV